MSEERARLIAEVLIKGAGVEPLLAFHVGPMIVELEAQADPVQEALIGANAWREHHAGTGAEITLEDAIALYRDVVPLRMVAEQRGSQHDNEKRNLLIVMMLEKLEGLGLPVTSHADDRSMKSSRTSLPRDERPPSLALAMHIATRIGESVIAAAWKRRPKG